MLKKMLSILVTITMIAMLITSTFLVTSCGNYNYKINRILSINYEQIFNNIEKDNPDLKKDKVLGRFMRRLVSEYDEISIDTKNSFYLFKYDEQKKISGWNETSVLYFLNEIAYNDKIKNIDEESFRSEIDLSKLINKTSTLKIENPNIQLYMAYILNIYRADESVNNREFVLKKVDEFINPSKGSNTENLDDEKVDLSSLGYSFHYKEPKKDSKKFVKEIYIPRNENIFKDVKQELNSRSIGILQKHLGEYNDKIKDKLEIDSAKLSDQGINKKLGTYVYVKLKSNNNMNYKIKVIEYLDREDLKKFIKNIWRPQVCFGFCLPVWRIIMEDKVKTNSIKIKFNKQLVEVLNDNLGNFLEYIQSDENYEGFKEYINWEKYNKG